MSRLLAHDGEKRRVYRPSSSFGRFSCSFGFRRPLSLWEVFSDAGWGEGCFYSEKPSPNQKALTPSIIDTGSQRERERYDDATARRSVDYLSLRCFTGNIAADIYPQITLIDADLFSGTCGKVKTCENHPWFILLKHVPTVFTTTIL